MFDAISDRQGQLLSLLQQAPAGLTVDALAGALGVTLNAVRQHLLVLERDGLVARGPGVPSGGRGRPQRLYALTEGARERFPRQYSWFSEMLLKAMRAEMGSEKLQKTLRILGDEAGAAVAPPTTAPPAERARLLAEKMAELGYDARVITQKNKLEIAARNCVFHKLAAEHPEVCAFDLGLIARAAGAEVSHEACIVRGETECRFRLQPSRKSTQG